jgi:lysophospholipase L1-like esterase
VAVVLCYGDSNTWGADPSGSGRFAPETRWTGVLRQALGPAHTVIEEGMNGRTTNIDDPIELHRDGRAFLPVCLESQRPFDLITIMLGTNDLKARFGRSASDIAQSAAALGVMAARSFSREGDRNPEVLLMAPPPIFEVDGLSQMFAGGRDKSLEFGERYRYFAERNGLHYLNVGDVIESSRIDGIHFDADAHAALGKAVADAARNILNFS